MTKNRGKKTRSMGPLEQALFEAMAKLRDEATEAAVKLGFRKAGAPELREEIEGEIAWWGAMANLWFPWDIGLEGKPTEPHEARVAVLESMQLMLDPITGLDVGDAEEWAKCVDEYVAVFRRAPPHAALERPEMAEFLKQRQARERIERLKRELAEAQKALPCCKQAA